MNRTLSGSVRDVALLISRLLLGTIMFAHGYQKLMIDGLGRTTQGFETMSIPVAIFSAAFVTVVEIVGGVLVILGALLTVVAVSYLVVMTGAAVFVHIPNGVFIENNGWELVGAIAALLLALAAAGSGRYGVDHRIRAWQARTAVVPEPVPDPPTPQPAARPASPATSAPNYAARASAFTEVLPRTPRTAADDATVTIPAPRLAPDPVPAPRAATDPLPAPLPVRRRRARPDPTPERTPES